MAESLNEIYGCFWKRSLMGAKLLLSLALPKAGMAKELIEDVQILPSAPAMPKLSSSKTRDAIRHVLTRSALTARPTSHFKSLHYT